MKIYFWEDPLLNLSHFTHPLRLIPFWKIGYLAYTVLAISTAHPLYPSPLYFLILHLISERDEINCRSAHLQMIILASAVSISWKHSEHKIKDYIAVLEGTGQHPIGRSNVQSQQRHGSIQSPESIAYTLSMPHCLPPTLGCISEAILPSAACFQVHSLLLP